MIRFYVKKKDNTFVFANDQKSWRKIRLLSKKDMPRMGFEPVSLVPKTSTLSSWANGAYFYFTKFLGLTSITPFTTGDISRAGHKRKGEDDDEELAYVQYEQAESSGLPLPHPPPGTYILPVLYHPDYW